MKTINLALQGGGAHGAFTWGALDHLLSDERLRIEGISGTSAGAMNAVILADGLARGGASAARERLAEFWRAVSINGNLPLMQRQVLDRLLAFSPINHTPVNLWFDAVARFLSPYDFNPLNINPLRDLIENFVDFDAIHAFADLQLFISATNVQTGRLHVFSRDKISADAVMASACLPHLFRAVEVDGVAYWDGGYLGNPVIFPFFRTTQTEDVVIVQINPVARKEIPTSSREIMDRINEITFNSSLLSEFRAIEFVTRLIDQDRLPRGMGPGEYRRINVHRIALHGVDTESKLQTDFQFFELLRDHGRRAARRFLDAHFDDIGVRGTVDLKADAQAEWA